MAVTVKVADCPGTINSCGSGWSVITVWSTTEGGRKGGREERREGGREGGRERGKKGERREGGREGGRGRDQMREGGSSSTTTAFYCHMKQNLSSHSFNNAFFGKQLSLLTRK